MTGSDPDRVVTDERRSEIDPVVRHGVDIVSVARIAALLDEFGDSFRDRVFTDAEQRYCERQGDPPQHYAARWAAKEAFLKTLADPSPAVPTAAVAVGRRDDGPHLALTSVARDALDATLDERGYSIESADITVSLSHDQTAGYAVGSVTIVAVDR